MCGRITFSDIKIAKFPRALPEILVWWCGRQSYMLNELSLRYCTRFWALFSISFHDKEWAFSSLWVQSHHLVFLLIQQILIQMFIDYYGPKNCSLLGFWIVSMLKQMNIPACVVFFFSFFLFLSLFLSISAIWFLNISIQSLVPSKLLIRSRIVFFLSFLYLFPFHLIVALLPQHWARFIESISWKIPKSFFLFLRLCFSPDWVLWLLFTCNILCILVVVDLHSFISFLFILHILMLVPICPDLLSALLML